MLNDHLKNYTVILGSGSPRRQVLLEQMGVEFEIWKSELEEIYPEELKQKQISEYLAKLKSDSFGDLHESQLLITCDTIVWANDRVYEKAESLAQAKEWLLELSSKVHEVSSSICLRNHEKYQVFSDTCQVEFLPIESEEIDYYLNCSPVLDKAGAYGIQDWLGLSKIKGIVGSYYTVMGLPTHLLYHELHTFIKN